MLRILQAEPAEETQALVSVKNIYHIPYITGT